MSGIPELKGGPQPDGGYLLVEEFHTYVVDPSTTKAGWNDELKSDLRKPTGVGDVGKWDEEKHPRAEDGKFSEAGDAGSFSEAKDRVSQIAQGVEGAKEIPSGGGWGVSRGQEEKGKTSAGTVSIRAISESDEKGQEAFGAKIITTYRWLDPHEGRAVQSAPPHIRVVMGDWRAIHTEFRSQLGALEAEVGKANIRGDLRKWQRKAKADLHRGHAPRPFASDVIPAGTRFWIEKGLAEGDLAKAFRKPTNVKRSNTSERAAAHVAHALLWWEPKLKRFIRHFTGIAIARLEHAHKLTKAEWDESKHPRDAQGEFTEDGEGEHDSREGQSPGGAQYIPGSDRTEATDWRRGETVRHKNGREAEVLYEHPAGAMVRWKDTGEKELIRGGVSGERDMVVLRQPTKKGMDDDWPDPDFEPAEYQELVASLEGMYMAGVADAAELVGGGRVAASTYARKRAADLIGRRWDVELGEWVDNPNTKWVISDTIRDKVREALARAIEEGEDTLGFRDELDALFGTDIPFRASLIARTETRNAYNRGALDNFEMMDVMQVEIMDGSGLGDICDEQNGMVVGIEEFMEISLARHPNCTIAPAPVLLEALE